MHTVTPNTEPWSPYALPRSGFFPNLKFTTPWLSRLQAAHSVYAAS